MADIVIKKKNDAFVKVDCDAGISHELAEYFTFAIPNARFHPAVKARKWDGKKRLFSYLTREVYAGLTEHIKKFADQREYSVHNTIVPDGDGNTREEIKQFTESLDYRNHEGEKLTLHDYQDESIYHAIHEDRLLLISPTSSGKSAMIAGVTRWHLSKDRRVLIIVPTTSLVSQMATDFDTYFKESGWRAKDHCHLITSGVKKTTDLPVVISTWQSIFELDSNYFNQFDCVIVDEAHQAKAKSITEIMEKCTHVRYRFGCTGTLDGSLTHKLVLIGLFGRIHQSITTRELMDNKQISDLKIKCLFLQYSDEEKKKVSQTKKINGVTVKGMEYAEEIDFLISHEKRNKFIKNIALTRDKNTLVLFNKIDHGKTLFDLINTEAADGRKVFLIYGDTDANSREEIRAIVERESNAIIIASYGTFSTGVSIRNIHYVIFSSPSKSRIRNLQSIGRGLRNDKGKEYCELIDISDDLSWKSRKNHTLNHMVERIKIYASEGFEYKIIRVNLTQ